jgi:hypothetical protein
MIHTHSSWQRKEIKSKQLTWRSSVSGLKQHQPAELSYRSHEQEPVPSQGRELSLLSLGENDQVLGVAQDRGADEQQNNP